MKQRNNNFIRAIITGTFMLGLHLNPHANAAQDAEKLSQAEWNVPRSAIVITNMAPVHKTIQKYQAEEDARIRIHYAGGDEGTLWVHELRSWLVALGIPSSRIELIPGATDPAQLELSVIKPIKTNNHNK